MSSVRKMLEEREEKLINKYGAKSIEAQRKREEEPCLYRTAIQRDRDRIIHSKAFRRLKHKTQVFVAPAGDHYRTRLTHTLEVAQISRTIARALSLNEDLVEAIALGHDVGHTPFGHAGELALRKTIGHYSHNEQSVRVLEVIENSGKGLNLTKYVLDGVLHHTGPTKPITMEGQIVKTGDRIAYLCHDLDDSVRAGLLQVSDLPQKVVNVLGSRPKDMITVMVADMINKSMNNSEITMSKPVEEAMDSFRSFMFEKIYNSPALEEERKEAEEIILKLYHHFAAKPEKLPDEFQQRLHQTGLAQGVVDYVAGLTDQYAVSLFVEVFGKEAVPKKISF